jgi:outer membrane lipoprotein-sorting protein
MRTPRVSRRWFVPVAAAGLIAGGGLLGPVVAGASPDLPDLTPEQLLTRAQTAKVDGLSGTVRTSVDLGLPALPGDGRGGPSELPSLISGEHTLRVAYAAPDKARVSVLDQMAERLWTTDGKTAWRYDSATREATRFALPERISAGREPHPRLDPQTVARRFLAAVDPSTKVEVTGTESVAGRDAYLLRLVPRTDRTLVGSVTLAVDARHWVPLRVTVQPRAGGDPAVEVGFTEVNFAVPPASAFAFTPPKGTDVTDETVPGDESEKVEPPTEDEDFGWSADDPGWSFGWDDSRVIGTGWETVVLTDWYGGSVLDQMLANAPEVNGSWGTGRVLTSRMLTALFLDDGRVLIGMVPTSVLESAAARAPR